jgi:Putative mono-oxygenase ydhR
MASQYQKPHPSMGDNSRRGDVRCSRTDGRWANLTYPKEIAMSSKLLQVNYNFNVTRAEYEAANLPWAQPFAEFPGLVWKIWLMNEAEAEAGGIVLFEDDAARQAYIDGPLAEAKSDPTISGISYKRFDVIDELSAITRGPLGQRTSA